MLQTNGKLHPRGALTDKAIGIIGAGRLGGALARSLKEAGCVLSGLTCASPDNSRAAAERLGIPSFADNRALCLASRIVFITVPDSRIVEVAGGLLAGQVWPGTVFIHCSGAFNCLALPPDERVARGSFHPLQSFAGGGGSLAGIYIAMDGEDAVLPVLHELCALLGGVPLSVPGEERPLYHAAACLASNHMVALLSVVEELFLRWADDPQAARAAFWPLLDGTLANFRQLGPGALTGPVARGDAATVARHLTVLPAEYKDFYAALSRQALRVAREGNLLVEDKAQALRQILKTEV